MADLILESFKRLIEDLDFSDPWPGLVHSGFLDVLRSEDQGGAGLDLAGLFPLVIELGRQSNSPAIAEAMVLRLAAPEGGHTPDVECALIASGVGADVARCLAATVTSGLMAGAMGQLLEITIEYASTRKQFGREIGKFQAVQQQISVMAQECVAARMAAEAAFVGAPLYIPESRAAVAKLRCGLASQVVCSVAHAVHGAIGISHEHPLHQYTGRLHGWRMAHGGESYWARRLGKMAIAGDSPVVDVLRAI